MTLPPLVDSDDESQPKGSRPLANELPSLHQQVWGGRDQGKYYAC
ncbi:hypothetical protein RSAG8_13034, partial [Rhizoctonia solani AG-8 WAC10335]